MYFVLVIIIILLLLGCWQVYNNEALAPAVIVLLMFLLSSVLGTLRYRDWHIYEYSFFSVLLLAIALFTFVTGSIFGLCAVPIDSNRLLIKPIRRRRIDAPAFLLSMVLLLMIATNVLMFVTIRRIVASLAYGHTTISEIINNYRIISTFYQDMYVFPSYIKLMGYFCTAAGTLGVFVLTHNIIFKEVKLRDAVYLLIGLLWVTVLLLQSSRSGILFVLAEGVYFVYFFLKMYYGWSFIVDKKILKWGGLAFVIFIALFVVMAIVIGRFASSPLNILDYVTVYISSGIRNFDLFIKEPPPDRSFGIETFPSIYKTLHYRFGFFEIAPNAWLEFRYIENIKTSNIYTCFRRYYSDFGFTGLLVFPFLMGYWFSMSYQRIKLAAFSGQIHFRMLLFAYLSRALFYMPIDDTLFEFEASVNGVFKMLLLFFMFKVLDRFSNINSMNGTYNIQ